MPKGVPAKTKVTAKQEAFAKVYLDTGDKKLAIMESGYAVNHGWEEEQANQILKSEGVRAYLGEKSRVAAASIVYLAQNAESEAVKLNAAKDILDRAGFKPIDVNVEVKVDIKQEVNDEKITQILDAYAFKQSTKIGVGESER